MKSILKWSCSLLVAVLFLSPLIWMVQASFRPEDEVFQGGLLGTTHFEQLTFQHYTAAWQRADMARSMLNSLLQIGGILAGGLLINAMAAYAFARMQFPGRDILFILVLVLIILPVEVLVVPLFLTARDLHLTGGYAVTVAALILPFMAKAFNIFFLRQHFLSLPTDLEEAAVMDGAGVFRVFWSVALPAVRPALATVVVLDVLTHWSDFIWPLVICTREETRTVQISLSNLFTQPPVQWGDILACAVIATLPVLFIFRTAQRYVVSGNLRTGIK